MRKNLFNSKVQNFKSSKLAVTAMCLFFVPCSVFAQSDSAKTVALDEITVVSTRLSPTEGLTSKAFAEKDLQQANNGANLPILLSKTPSLVVTSDDGLGIGYTYFRIRGTDHTRINMTVNGVPLNDSESQTVFWVNMTDFASNLSSVNVQRGVGSSTNGSSAFGASVNMLTDKVSTSPYASIAFNGGMYKTFRENVQIGTGLLPSGFAFDAHFSKVNSDGYLERAFSDLYSYYGAAGYYSGNTMFKLLIFGGNERTYMAWDGVDAETLKNTPRYNPAGHYTDNDGNDAFYKNQTDNYAQQNSQLQFSHIFSNKWNINATLHYTHGAGFYEQYKENKKFADYGLENFTENDGIVVKRSDLVRRKNLDNNFYGLTASANYNDNWGKLSFGGAMNNYSGDHFGNVIWLRNYKLNTPIDYEYYRNTGKKFDANLYAKAQINITKEISVFGDLQERIVNYLLSGLNDEDRGMLDIKENFNFFNPKFGINYSKNGHSAYANFAVANREPTRKNYTEAGMHDLQLPEMLFDYELGYNYAEQIFTVGANLYFMDYKNQLVLTGKYSDTGAYLTKNVAKSYRVGLEIIGGVQIAKWLRWDGNLTLSQNKSIDYIDWVDDWTSGEQIETHYGTTDISFSPNVTAGSLFDFSVKNFGATLQTLFVGRQYLDNTQNESASLKPYSVTNLVLSYSLPVQFAKNLTFKIMANNLFNAHFASNGGSYGYFESADSKGNFLPENQKYSPWYYAQAGINLHGGVVVEF